MGIIERMFRLLQRFIRGRAGQPEPLEYDLSTPGDDVDPDLLPTPVCNPQDPPEQLEPTLPGSPAAARKSGRPPSGGAHR